MTDTVCAQANGRYSDATAEPEVACDRRRWPPPTLAYAMLMTPLARLVRAVAGEWERVDFARPRRNPSRQGECRLRGYGASASGERAPHRLESAVLIDDELSDAIGPAVAW